LLGKYGLGKIVENAVTVVTAMTLGSLSYRPFLDRVRTARVRTRYLIWPSVITEILQTIVLVGQKDFVHALSAGHLETNYEFHSKEVFTATDERSVERVFREIKRRTICFSNCFSNAMVETADNWLRSLSFVWNQLSDTTFQTALSSSGSLRSEQVVVSGGHDTRRPAQRELRRGL
jgi:hypothetical protein